MKIIQFAYNKQVPVGVPVVDCRTIPNPFNRKLTDAEMKNRVRLHPEFRAKVEVACIILKDSPVVAIGCAHGRHRSGAVAEEVSRITGAKIENVA